jgi:hypothetical protein
MNRKRKTGRVVAYLLATVAGTILYSPIALDIMWRDAHGYADEDPTMSDIHSGDGFFTILTAFSHVVVVAALIRGIAFFTTGGGTVLDSPSAGADGDGQAVRSIPNPTPTPTEIPTLPPIEKERNETGLKNDTQHHE